MGSLNLTHVQIKGVKEVFEKHKDEVSKGIKVHFNMDESGILNVDKVCYLNHIWLAKINLLTFRSILYLKKLRVWKKKNRH